jgi:hypothetical protein
MSENLSNVVRLLSFPNGTSRLPADSIRFFADLLRVLDVVV